MAVAMFMHWPGITEEDYESVRGPVNWEGDVPEGAQFHVASFDSEGAHICDIWESEETFNRFAEQRLMPEIQRQGRIQTQPDVKFYPVHAMFAPMFEGAGARA